MIRLYQALTSLVANLESTVAMASADFGLAHCQSSGLGTDLLADESLEGGGVGVADVVIIQEWEGFLQKLPLLLRATSSEHLQRC